jgi:hypothetical protein
MGRYLVSFGIVTSGWLVLSFALSLKLANAEDNPDMMAATPWPLKVASAIAFFPMRYLQHWDHSRMIWVVVGMLVNAIFWGLLFSLLIRLARTVAAK